MEQKNKHALYMLSALEEAKSSFLEVPVGAVLVKDNEIIAKAHNLKEQNNNVFHNAMDCFQAFNYLFSFTISKSTANKP